jgi:hypothetical protein
LDFANLQNFRGATAVYSIGESGDFRKEPILLTISGGKIRAVEDLPGDEKNSKEHSSESILDHQEQVFE